MSPRLPGSSTKKKAQNEGTYFAMVFVVLCVIGFIALTSMILPQISGLIYVAVGFSGFIALHYFTWGRWMIRYAERENQKAANDEKKTPVETPWDES